MCFPLYDTLLCIYAYASRKDIGRIEHFTMHSNQVIKENVRRQNEKERGKRKRAVDT
jgi:hypothetical protein